MDISCPSFCQLKEVEDDDGGYNSHETSGESEQIRMALCDFNSKGNFRHLCQDMQDRFAIMGAFVKSLCDLKLNLSFHHNDE